MRTRRGFTLIELLVVIAIIGILAVLMVPAVRGLMGSSQLTDASDLVAGQLKYARQLATSENKEIEVRFYKYADPHRPGSEVNMRAMQLWRANADGTRSPVGQLQRFPGQVIASSVPTVTTLGADRSPSVSETLKSLPSGYQYKAIQFRPDGSCTLSAGSNFLTLVNETDPPKSSAQIPANFSTIQVEVLTGAISVFRP